MVCGVYVVCYMCLCSVWVDVVAKCCESALDLLFCQAEDGIRGLVRSRGLGDVYKRQEGNVWVDLLDAQLRAPAPAAQPLELVSLLGMLNSCLLYTSDAADERSSVDLGGRRIIKKKKTRREQ